MNFSDNIIEENILVRPKGKSEDRAHERKYKAEQTQKACRLPLRGINTG